jgi:shikimate kinase
MQPDHAIPQVPLRIVLTGFMGAGKSTAGPILAERLGWRFVDADDYLRNRTGATIADLFFNLGETAFRQMEAEAFAELHRERDLVLALGGGAIESESIRSLLQQSNNTCVVFLSAPLDVLIKRCDQQPDAAIRPVLRQREALGQRFHSRLPHYQRAHITVHTQDLHPDEVVDRILLQLAENFPATPWNLKATAI